MDCEMPVLDGFAATQRIRAIEQARGVGRIPVVALTAHATGEDRERALSAGMDDFLSKPFSIDQLRCTLATHFRAADPNPRAQA